MRMLVAVVVVAASTGCATLTEPDPGVYVVEGGPLISAKAFDTCEDMNKDIVITQYESYRVTFRCD